MRPLRNRLREARRQLGLQSYVVERDYILSWVLAGIGAVPELKDTLVFKGGTALKKCYFGDYRFSEDLDFSALEGVPTGEAMEELMALVCEAARKMLYEYADVEFVCQRHLEHNPHPGGQEAFEIHARLPWHPRPDIPVKVEITVDELIAWPVERRSIIHGYGEPLDVELQIYSPTEVVAEKLRAIRQQLKLLEQRGWTRNRARDYYDLWRVLGTFGDSVDRVNFIGRFHDKCKLRNVDFEGPDDFFDSRVIDDVKQGWESSLAPLVTDLPDFDTVMGELQPQVELLLEPAP